MNPSEARHPHRWRIDEVDGSTSPGVCQTCGMERVFKNWSIGSEALGRAQAGLPPSQPPAPHPPQQRRQSTKVG